MATPMAAGVALIFRMSSPRQHEVIDIMLKSSITENYFLAQTPEGLTPGGFKRKSFPNQYPFPRNRLQEELIDLQSDSLSKQHN